MAPRKIDRDALRALVGQLEAAITDAADESTPLISDLWVAYEPSTRRYDSHHAMANRARHLMTYFGQMQAGDINLGHIEAYRRKREAELTPRGTPTKPGTRDLEVQTLLRILNWSVSHKLIRSHQLLKVPQKDLYENANNTRRTLISEEQLDAILKGAEPWVRAAVLVAIDSGMRRGEILAMRWDQLDRRKGLIYIDAQDTKTEEARVTVLSDRALDAIRQLKRSSSSSYVFATPSKRRHLQGGHYNAAYLSMEWRRLCDEAGVRGPDGDVRLHDCRKAFCTRARQAGLDTTEIKRMSGHRTDAAFKRYNLINVGDIVRARATLAAAHAEDREELRRQRLQEQERRAPKKVTTTPAPAAASPKKARDENR